MPTTKFLISQRRFTENLEAWNACSNTRKMPWKGETDPYKIWLSEVILQQTRVEQGLEYYNRFVKTFPTIQSLAGASETKVFKLWEGLGYYTRCKNLIATAKYITEKLDGRFPDQYENILALKGIGPYTAAAIGSFAFNLPYAVVDGNVFRVLSRYFGITAPTDSVEGKKLFTGLANDLLDKKQPGTYNQALMDFGAVICKPQLPLCPSCVMKNNCAAFTRGIVKQLPVKAKSIAKKTRWFYYLVIEHNNNIYIRKRGAGDIWENLYEFVLVEAHKPLSLEGFQALKDILGESHFEAAHISSPYKQVLTHQTIYGQFIRLNIKEPLRINGYKLIRRNALQKLPFPKFISRYLKDKNVSLNLF